MKRFKFTLAIIVLLFFWQSATAQFYPTQYRPSVDWQQLSTQHFKIIFPRGEDSVAWHTARILEHQYPKVQALTGGSLSGFPVILTNYNDRSNGLVTSLHFRSEIDIPPIKGKALDPETGGWLENVVPHELVHALQLNTMGGFGIGQIVNIFSPDLARSMHGASPAGVREGLAVYHESESVVEDGGRGNYPYFNNQFNAIFNSPGRWSMGQMVHFPANTRPFNRHYIGGYEFTQWLQDTYGYKTSRDAIDFNIRWPFLGYGVALKHATGQWPSQLYNEFEEDKQQEAEERTTTEQQSSTLALPFDGAEIRRPKWLSDSTLIFHASFYNARAGFYRYNLSNESLDRLFTTGSISDYNYGLSPDKQMLIYSYNKPDAIYPNAYNATLVKASLKNEKIQKLVSDHRLFAPTFSADSTILALKNYKASFELIETDISKQTNQSVKLLYTDKDSQLDAVEAHPASSDTLAVVVNHEGNQGIWIASKQNLRDDLMGVPAISFASGSVFDPVWHPLGDRLLFSADFSGTLQVYEYNLKTNAMMQVTNADYNAFEASYSPDGDRIAYIIQQQNKRLPAILSRENFYNAPVEQSFQSETQPGLTVTDIDDSSWNQESYSTGFSWLKPRTLLPAFEEVPRSDIYQIGLGLHSSDLLQQQVYSLEFTGAQQRLWYDLTYQNKQFFPGFKARIFSEPSFTPPIEFTTSDDEIFTQKFLRQQRSFALSIPMQFTLEQNVYFSSLYVEPEIRQSQIRYFNLNGDKASDFSNATIGNVFAQFNYKLQQNIRDVQPNTGLVLYGELEQYLGSEGFTLTTSRGTTDYGSSAPTVLRGGVYGYLSPLRRWNQSLRVGLRGITQTAGLFNNQSIVSEGFEHDVFPFANNLVSFNTRYTIPIVYPDNGGFLLPLYLGNMYLAAFSDTVFDPTNDNGLEASRTVLGGGVRMQFRISNLSFDIGFGMGVEPSRHNIHYFIGNF